MRISVLVSGGGTDLQSVIDGVESGQIENAEIVQVISSKHGVYSLERAARHGIPALVISKKEYPDIAERMDAILRALEEADTDLVVLAGYLSIISREIVETYHRRIINIHPARLPKFGGKGMYGLNVHKAVLAAGEKESGATVHYVDEGIDTGSIILQSRVPVMEDDTPESLQERVLETEHRILPEAVAKIAAEWTAARKA